LSLKSYENLVAKRTENLEVSQRGKNHNVSTCFLRHHRSHMRISVSAYVIILNINTYYLCKNIDKGKD